MAVISGGLTARESVAGGIMQHGLVWAIEPTVGLAFWDQALSLPMGAHIQAFAQSRDLAPSVLPAARYLENRGAYYDGSFVGEPHHDAGSKPYMLSSDGVAQFAIEGPMTKKVAMSAAGTSTAHLRRMMSLAERDRDVRSGIIKIDSPGGSVAGTDDLAKAVRSFASRKPIYAFAEDFMASAAVWVAAGCTRIFATPTTHIGSIGTILVIPDMSKMAKNAGVEVHVITSDGADYKGAGAPGTAITEKHKAYFRSMVNGMQAHFAGAVSQGRRITPDAIKALAGRMFIAGEAQGLGLIDGIRAYDDAVAELAGTEGTRSRGASKMFSLGGLQAVLPALPVNALGSVLEVSQAALLAACDREGIHTATDLQLACQEARKAREIQKHLMIQVRTGYDALHGPVKGAQYWSSLVQAGQNTLLGLKTASEVLLSDQKAAPAEAIAQEEAWTADDARSAGRAYAEKMCLFDIK